MSEKKKIDISDKWRLDLLSSSIPLEYLVAGDLVRAGIHVGADFTYRRTILGEPKDFSVDISATGYSPFSDPNRLDAELRLLVECKYRRPGWCVLFFRDVNPPDMSSFTLGHTIRLIDQFSPDMFPVSNRLQDFDRRRTACYKGVEVALEAWERSELKDRVDDSKLRHGIGQLQYAIPEAVKLHVNSNLSERRRLREALALFLVPIYVTTAPLYIANTDITFESIVAAKSIDDISESVDSLIMIQDYGPDYAEHWRETFYDLQETLEATELTDLSSLRASYFDLEHFTTDRFMESLIHAARPELFGLAMQFVVCTRQAFPKIVREIKTLVNATVRKRTRLPSEIITEYWNRRASASDKK